MTALTDFTTAAATFLTAAATYAADATATASVSSGGFTFRFNPTTDKFLGIDTHTTEGTPDNALTSLTAFLDAYLDANPDVDQIIADAFKVYATSGKVWKIERD